MERKAVSGIMLTLLLMGMLTSAFNVQPVKGELAYYYKFMITVTPESPSIDDEIFVTVSFETASISYIVEFSALSQVGKRFFVDIDIYVPDTVIWIIGYEAETYHLGKLPEGSYSFNVDVRVWDLETRWLLEWASYSKLFTVVPAVIAATVDIDPDTLNLISKGEWITAYVELLEGYDVSDIDVSTILLDDTVPVDPEAPIEVGDYDDDGIPDLMVKFDRAEVMALLSVGEATLTITGEVNGTPFEASDKIRVIDE